MKDRAVEILLSLAEDENRDSDRRRFCAEAVGRLGEKEKAIRILITLYHNENDKRSDNARQIYDSLWDLTAN